jgi:hypothetical protein
MMETVSVPRKRSSPVSTVKTSVPRLKMSDAGVVGVPLGTSCSGDEYPGVPSSIRPKVTLRPSGREMPKSAILQISS